MGVVEDIVKQCKVMKNGLEAVHEISKLIKNSPKRDTMLQKVKCDLSMMHLAFECSAQIV